MEAGPDPLTNHGAGTPDSVWQCGNRTICQDAEQRVRSTSLAERCDGLALSKESCGSLVASTTYRQQRVAKTLPDQDDSHENS